MCWPLRWPTHAASELVGQAQGEPGGGHRDAFDGNDFAASRSTTGDGHGSARQRKASGQKPDDLVVGRAIDRWGGDAQFERVAVHPGDFGSRRARLNVQLDPDPLGRRMDRH